jgi:NAD(P)H-dependent FMN reductase
MTKLAILIGSHRPQSQSAKVGRFVETLLANEFPDLATFFLDLGENPLPLWDEGVRTWTEPWEKVWREISQNLQSCDGIIVVAPEWNGGVPASLKNFFLLCEGKEQELAHKPGLIIAVSSNMGGAYSVAELRMSSFKNTHICYLPEHVIIRNVGDLFNDPGSLCDEELKMRDRIRYAVLLLNEYARALRSVRESGAVDSKRYPWGM